MPYSIYARLGFAAIKDCLLRINLANTTHTYPLRIVEDILVKIDEFTFPTDFVVLDMKEDEMHPIILGRQFLRTSGAIVDFKDRLIMIRIGDKAITFGDVKSLKRYEIFEESIFNSFVSYPNHYPSIFKIYYSSRSS